MTAFDDQHSVWTDNPDPAWAARNGTPAMRLIAGASLDDARTLCQRLLLILPVSVFWIENVRGDEVSRFEIREPLATSKDPGKPGRRRKLGMPCE